MIPRRLLSLAAAVASACGLAGCYLNEPKPPLTANVCYYMTRAKTGAYKFVVVAPKVADLEHCAADLEVMREHFIALGSNRYEVWGVYQGQYIYINRVGLFSSQFVNGPQYPLLVRTGDGRLARPGTVMIPTK